MPSIDKNATQQKKSEASKPLTLLARPVYPGTRGTPHTNNWRTIAGLQSAGIQGATDNSHLDAINVDWRHP